MFITQEVVPITFFFLRIFVVNFKINNTEYKKHTSPIVLVMPGWKQLFLSLDVNWKQTVSELIQNIWWWCSSKACLLYKRWFHLYIYFFFYVSLFFVNFKINNARYKKNIYITNCSCNARLEATVSEPGCELEVDCFWVDTKHLVMMFE